MKLERLALHSVAACAAAIGLLASPLVVNAQTAPAKHSAKATKASKKAAPSKASEDIAPASPEQVAAAERVFYGVYECEENKSVNISASAKHASYVDLKHGKSDYLMKPVLSSTGAIRLEDVRKETLLVQIASKSMLLNVKSGQRIVDACVSPKQREMNNAAQSAKVSLATGN